MLAALALALALPIRALDFSGTVRNKMGAPISGAQVCIKSDPTSCVTTGVTGLFSIVKTIAIRNPGQGFSGFSMAHRGASLIVNSPAAVTARLEWLSGDGRRIWSGSEVKLAAGANSFALPAGLPHAGLCILRLSTPDHVLTWKAVLASGMTASGGKASPAAARIASLAKVATVTLEVTKTGYRTRTYTPFADVEAGINIELSETGDVGVSFDGSLSLKVIGIDRTKKTFITESEEAACDTADGTTVVRTVYRDTVRYQIREGKMWTWYEGDCIGQMFTGTGADPVGSWNLVDPNALLPEDLRAGCTSDSGTGLGAYEAFSARYTISESRIIAEITAEICPNEIFLPIFFYILGQDTAVQPTKNTCKQMVLKNGKGETGTVDYTKAGDSLNTKFTYKTLTCEFNSYFGLTPVEPVCPEGEEVFDFMSCLMSSGFASVGPMGKTSAAAPSLPMSRDRPQAAYRPDLRLRKSGPGWLSFLRNAPRGGDYISPAWKAKPPAK